MPDKQIDRDQGKGAHSSQQARHVGFHGPWLVKNYLINAPSKKHWYLNILLRVPNRYLLLAKGAICNFMVTITDEQNIICNKTHLDGTTHE